MEKKSTLIHWFRKGLRVHDNPALAKVFNEANAAPEKYVVRPIFILDPGIIGWIRVGANRWRFLQQTLADLHQQLLALNSRLYVVRGSPAAVFPRLFKEWQTELLTYEIDIEPYALKRDAQINKLAKELGIKIETHATHTIYNPEVVLQRNMGKAPLTFQKYMSVVEKIKVPEPLPKPNKLPAKIAKPPFDEWERKDAACYDCPTLELLVEHPEQLGVNKFPGGETEALRRFDASFSKEQWIAKFEKPNTAPNSLEPSTTVLSPYMKFGCLSSRLFFHRLHDVYKRHSNHSKPPVSLLGQLMWRELYYTAAATDPNFDRMVGNAFSLQIPWESNPVHLEAWAHGRTGYPFIDAIMRQLRQEGWIHHLARHAVACFLTRGDLWISWEEGQRVFEELLLDQDWALNAGNWMWLSASAFFYKYFRVYSPVAFGKKTDPTGNYIRKYVPELAKYPAGVIYEPWKATLSAQREYGCIIGENYPERIVNHETIHKINLQRMNAAYKVNREVRKGKAGNDEDDDDIETSTSTAANKRSKKSIGAGAKKKRKN